MPVETADKVVENLQEKAKAGEECCAAGQGVDVACAMAEPAGAEVKQLGRREGGESGGEPHKEIAGVYLNAKAPGQEHRCVKSEVLVEYVKRIIETCGFKKEEEMMAAAGNGEKAAAAAAGSGKVRRSDEMMVEERKKEEEEKGREEERKRGEEKGVEEEKKIEEEKKTEEEKKGMVVAGWQNVVESESKDLYISLHSGPAQGKAEAMAMGKEEGKAVNFAG